MEKGHFHEPGSNIIENLGLESEQRIIDKMPIPSELPKSLDLSGVPLSVLRSGTIDALINQNEDLMARLGVSLRRSSQIEDKLSRLEKLNTAIGHKNEVLKDQLLVLQEKDRVISERSQRVERTISEYKEKIQLLETQYAEIYTDSKDKQRNLLTQIDTLSRRLSRLLKYRRQIKLVSKALKARCQKLEKDFNKEQELNALLKKNISELTNRIQSLGREGESNQKALVNNYEDRILEYKNKITLLEKHSHLLEEKTNQAEELYERKIELENLLVGERRGRDQQKLQYDKEISALQKEISAYRGESKSHLIESEEKQRLLDETNQTLEQIRSENSKLLDQVEALQALWKDSQTQFERQNDKNQALQTLNQQLSTSLNQYRKEIQRLKASLEVSEAMTKEKIRQIQGQVQILNQATAKNDGLTQEKVEQSAKIETLIAEIQSGFSKDSSDS